MGIKYAFRTLLRSTAFTATVVLTLALGIGASAAVFSAIDRLLLRALPYPEPDRLVSLHETQTGKGQRPVSLPNLLDWRAQASSFDGVAGFMPRSFGLHDQGQPVSVVMAGMVTSDLFRVLGSGAQIGRTFTEREEFDNAQVIVLTDELWASQFHRAAGIVGRTLQLNEQPFEVIGILPPFVYPVPATHIDVYIPISHRDYYGRDARPLQAVARLKPGVTIAGAQSELRTIAARLAVAYPAENARGGADLQSLDESWKGNLRRPLQLLTGAALLLLALVCTNVVNLLLARTLQRAREMEIRTALGASLGDIVRQLLAEALVLCAGGAALGLALANTVLRLLPMVLKQPVQGLAIDRGALWFAAAVGVLVMLLCALAPALSTKHNRRPFRLRQGLVVGQVALSLVLLLSAGAFLRVFLKLANRNPGFDSSHVYSFGFGLPEGRYTDPQTIEFLGKLRARIAEIPGVEASGAVNRLPLNTRGNSTTFQFEGAALPPTEWPSIAWNAVDPAYFQVLRIPLLAGRRLDWETDGVDHPPVVVVNRAFEKQYGRGGSVVGKRLQLRAWNGRLRLIVGVVGDTYQTGLDQAIRPQIYFPVSQTGLDGGSYVVRTSRQDDAALASALAAAVRSIDPNLERIRVRRLDTWVHDSLGDRRLPAILTGLFAFIGLSLTALGLYGTIALEIGQRRKEVAIRLALGATHRSITRLVLQRGLVMTAAGAFLGAIGFIPVGRAIESQLYEVAPSDPMNAAIVLAILFLCALAACLRPAWDALRQAPIAVLREN